MVGSSGASLTRNPVGQQPRQRRVVRRPPLKAEEEEAWRERRHSETERALFIR
jgi:hypothetical protein